MTLRCINPRFEWLGSCWSACTRCRRLAWDHEQADPSADMFAALTAMLEGRSLEWTPPTMLTEQQYLDRLERFQAEGADSP